MFQKSNICFKLQSTRKVCFNFILLKKYLKKYTMLEKAVGLQRIANKQSDRKSLVIVYRKSRLLGRALQWMF